LTARTWVSTRLPIIHGPRNLNLPTPFADSSFDAVISVDVMVHLRNREMFFDEMARLLVPGGRLLLTDAGVITGPISNEEVERRSSNGYTQFVPPGGNENLLGAAGGMLRTSFCMNSTAAARQTPPTTNMAPIPVSNRSTSHPAVRSAPLQRRFRSCPAGSPLQPALSDLLKPGAAVRQAVHRGCRT
jgi:SAM-dependent methyltransferase